MLKCFKFWLHQRLRLWRGEISQFEFDRSLIFDTPTVSWWNAWLDRRIKSSNDFASPPITNNKKIDVDEDSK